MQMPDKTSNTLTHDIGRQEGRLHRFRGSGALWRPLAALLSAFTMFLPAAFLALRGENRGRGAWDATVYHEPFIRQLAADWPRLDFSNPLTATTPGYHLLLAVAVRLGLDSTTALRVLSALIGAVFVGSVAWWCAQRVRARDAWLLSLPLAASIYPFQSAAWLLPDNLAWLGVFAVVGLCIRARPTWAALSVASVVLTGLVFTRQVHLWCAGLIWLTAWIGIRHEDPGLFRDPMKRFARTILAVCLTLPAFLVVAWFVRTWGGLTPPRFQGDMQGGNPATPAFLLVQVAILGVGFWPWLAPAACRLIRDHAATASFAIGIGLLAALIPETTNNPEAGRYSGWWSLTAKAPVLMGRTSLIFVVLAPIGAVLLAGALRSVPRRAGWTLLAALAGFTLAQSSTALSWQRYHEPFLLLLLAILAALQPPELRSTPMARARVPAMGLLCVILGAISVASVRGNPVKPGTPPPPKHTSPNDPWAKEAQDSSKPGEPGASGTS